MVARLASDLADGMMRREARPDNPRMITGLDHTGLAVADLAAARARFAALGFTLTQRETLMKPGPDGRPVSSGADNHVIMFERGYQELIAIVDPAAGHMLLPRLARYMGLHIVVLASDEAEADRTAAAARGCTVTPCMTWDREVQGKGTARFRFFLFADAEAPEALLCVVQHLTPELLRTPELVRHANGATALRGCILHVADAAEARARYERLLGLTSDDDTFRFPDGTTLRLADAAVLARAFPGATLPPAPAVAAIEVEMRNPARLGASGATLHESPDGVWLGPEHLFGATLRVRPAPYRAGE
jgi:catechol 2,3-dioxygenase-like lactoylglutathione lyase family enzyme